MIKQLNFLEQRDTAMEAVEQHAAQHAPAFAEQAAEFILGYLADHGPTPGETLTDACRAAGIKPHDDRAFGPVYMKLVRAGLIWKAGRCIRKKGHGTAGGNIWDLQTPSDAVG